MAMSAPYPFDKSTTADNANVLPVDLVLTATYQQTSPPAGTSFTASGVTLWTIASTCLDLQPGDMLTWIPVNTVNNAGGAVLDALLAVGVYPVAVVVTGTGPCTLKLAVWNPTAGAISSPASNNPLIILDRYTNLSTDPNPIP
jgi:hypothetical protein